MGNDLEKRIGEDLNEALKSKKTIKVSALRMLRAAMKNEAIAKRKETLEDADVIAVIKRQLKQRRESIEAFTKGNREDLAKKEKEELDILAFYMPPELSSEEILKVVLKAIEETAAEEKKDMGKVMKAVMEELKGQADGKLVNKIVMENLTKPEGGDENGSTEEG